MSLYAVARVNQDVFDILNDRDLNHQQATDLLNSGAFGFTTSRTSVRRAREQLGVVSPESPKARESQFWSGHREGLNEPEYRETFESVTSEDVESTLSMVTLELSPEPTTALFLGDFQCSLHSVPMLERAIKLIEDVKPDKIIHLGDEVDAGTISRYARGGPEEIEGNLQQELDDTHYWLSEMRRAAPDAEIRICHSNHSRRFEDALQRRLPGFRTLRVLQMESLLGLGELGIHYDRQIQEVLPGLIAAHGDRWGLTSKGQRTKGPQLVRHAGKSIVAGHTHSGMLVSCPIGFDSEPEQSFYMNTGCMMDYAKASYMENNTLEWSQNIGIVHAEGGHLFPELIHAYRGRFRYGGKTY